MIFCGDIAIPNQQIPIPGHLFPEEYWVGNLEGSLVKNGEQYVKDTVVFNDLDAIKGLCDQMQFKLFNIANNHLTDVPPVRNVLTNAETLGIPTVGGGFLSEASQPVLVKDNDGIEYLIFSFGWECIKCQYAKPNKEGVNPYKRKYVRESLEKYISTDVRVVCLFHWNYELETIPSPYDRAFAHELIDLGVYAVIGCHAHRTQPIEMYKGHPIVYGMGNFLFPSHIYWNGRSAFPKYTQEELLVELKGNAFRLHWLSFNQDDNTLKLLKSETIGLDAPFYGRAEFEGFSDEDYRRYFQQYRHSKFLLPVFESDESQFSYWIKSRWVILRGNLIDVLVGLNIKKKRSDE